MPNTITAFFNRDTNQLWVENADGTTERIGDGHPCLIAVAYVLEARGLIRTGDWLIVPGVPHLRQATYKAAG